MKIMFLVYFICGSTVCVCVCVSLCVYIYIYMCVCVWVCPPIYSVECQHYYGHGYSCIY